MKGVAIPYVIGFLIAIIVLAVAVFLIYRYIIGPPHPLACSECGAKFAAWCSKCYLKGCTDTYEMSEELEKCVKDCGHWANPSNDCSAAEDACKAVGVLWCTP